MSSAARPVDPLALDLASLAYLSGLAAQEAVLAVLAKRHPSLRFSHGFVFQHLLRGPHDVGALAQLLGVTSQAASKSVQELAHLGYVELAADPADARRTVARLSRKGRACVEEARAARAVQEEALVAAVGPAALATTKRVLGEALALAGGVDAVRGRRVRPPR